MGTVSGADAALLWRLRATLSAEAALPEPTLEEDTGNGQTCPLSPVFTGAGAGGGALGSCTDGRTDCHPADVCMGCPILPYESSISLAQRKVTDRKWCPEPG